MKSPEPITFVCLNAGNYCGRGAEYVNTLFDMVARNMPPGRPFKFYCLTDDPTGIDARVREDGTRIRLLDLPKDLERWYGKLYLFKRGLFPDGTRLVFFDLDTVIVGKLDDLVDYRGQFATLTDFYYPERLGPAVMAWEASGYTASIWEEWVAAGTPRNELGDLWWLTNLHQGRFAKEIDRLQKLFPAMFVSYKRHCTPFPPKGARVVCFHGIPRPHEATDEWVGVTWQVGGQAPANLETVGNTSKAQTAKNIAAACALNLPWLEFSPAHEREVAVVAGGPSLPEFLPELRAKAAAGVRIVAVNGAHDYLVNLGIHPHAHVIIDARPECARFITLPARSYLLASQCAPETFEKARLGKAPITVVHMHTEDVLDSIPLNTKPVNLISSGSTVGLAAIAIEYCRGHRRIYVYGMDSSHEEARHAYPQSLNDNDRVIEATAGGRKFKCAPWMVAQAEHFQKLVAELANDGCEIHVRCRGLLGHVAWCWAREGVAA